MVAPVNARALTGDEDHGKAPHPVDDAKADSPAKITSSDNRVAPITAPPVSRLWAVRRPPKSATIPDEIASPRPAPAPSRPPMSPA